MVVVASGAPGTPLVCCADAGAIKKIVSAKTEAGNAVVFMTAFSVQRVSTRGNSRATVDALEGRVLLCGLLPKLNAANPVWRLSAFPQAKLGSVFRGSSPHTARYRVRTRYTRARPTPSFFAIAVAPRPSLQRRRTSSALMLGFRPFIEAPSFGGVDVSICRSRLKSFSTPAKTPSIDKNALPAALRGVDGLLRWPLSERPSPAAHAQCSGGRAGFAPAGRCG